MSDAKLEAYFFTATFVLAIVVVGIIFFPFIGSLALALVLATLVYPVYSFLVRVTQSEFFSALLVTLLMFISILAPATGLSFLLVDELKSMSTALAVYDLNRIPTAVSMYRETLEGFLPVLSEVHFSSVLQGVVDNMANLFTSAITGTASYIIKFVVSLVALFYFIKDGRRFLRELIALSPLSDFEDEAIMQKINDVTHSLIRGTLAVAVMQGMFVGIGFVLFGVPSPVLWGSVAAISALIPTLGTGIVSAPAILYLFVTGQMAAGIGLTAWAMLIVGLVDNIIGPKLMGSRAKIHPLFVLVSVLGGLSVFGISGFLLGPLLFGFLVALSEIYKVKMEEIHRASAQ